MAKWNIMPCLLVGLTRRFPSPLQPLRTADNFKQLHRGSILLNQQGASVLSFSSKVNTSHKAPFWPKLPSNQVLEGIDVLPRNNKSPWSKTVTVADVATAAEVPLDQAKSDCFLLAATLASRAEERGATSISVSADGELLFSFAAPVQVALERCSSAYRWRLTWQNEICLKLTHALRVSFGANKRFFSRRPEPV
jgi:hypothetical protein